MLSASKGPCLSLPMRARGGMPVACRAALGSGSRRLLNPVAAYRPTTRTQQVDPVSKSLDVLQSTVSSVDGNVYDGTSQANIPSTDASDLPIIGPLARAWQDLDVRKKIVLACSAGFCLSNMDKCNFTVAIIPIAAEMGWKPTVAGLVQSAFFYGFLIMQPIGGYLSTKFGGAYVLPRGVALWSSATAAMPLVVGNLPALCVARSIMGIGEATAPSSILDLVTRSMPGKERASATSFAFGGLHVGSIIGLLSSPWIISHWGWPNLFYTFGLAGAVWIIWFNGIVEEVRQKDPELAVKLFPGNAAAATSVAGGQRVEDGKAAQQVIPYRAFIRSKSVRVIMFTHFAHNYMHYTMLSWLPTFYVNVMSVDLTHAAQTALLPPIVGIVASAAAGSIADGLASRNVPVATIRKLAQSVGFLAPALFLTLVTQIDYGSAENWQLVACITAALGISSFSLAGLYCSHGDLSPKYSSALLGMTNIAGSTPGIVGVTLVGFLYDQTSNWDISLFAPSIALLLAGTAVYVSSSTHDQIDFDAADNSPFEWENRLRNWASANPVVQGLQGIKNSITSAAKALSGKSE